ncbi:NYN domain, limkain-b1-type [Cynara cardunculus var. scolymus]|uniref:NYN domain, limkain-b1-type n=1 Tax=Cynara cardunculus var. scolymus TaxID=59895 RepID=A0A118JVE8_CYNCS|nr:NYN domain, limkain-b1-type [Cynara cardunculus var. scolymus]
MKTFSFMTIFLYSSSRRLFFRTTPPPFFNSDGGQPLVRISYFSTSSSDSFASSAYHSSSRRNPEDVRNEKVSVWWDFENCSIPCSVNVYKVTQCITSAVRANDLQALLENQEEPEQVQEELLSSSSKLKAPMVSVDSQALPEKQEPQKVQEQPPLIERAKEGEGFLPHHLKFDRSGIVFSNLIRSAPLHLMYTLT